VKEKLSSASSVPGAARKAISAAASSGYTSRSPQSAQTLGVQPVLAAAARADLVGYRQGAERRYVRRLLDRLLFLRIERILDPLARRVQGLRVARSCRRT